MFLAGGVSSLRFLPILASNRIIIGLLPISSILPVNNDEELAKRIKEFQFKDLRPKAASDMNNIELASKLLGHTKEEITRKVYIRIGQEVEPLNRDIGNKKCGDDLILMVNYGAIKKPCTH